ncbi:serpin family protein [Nocardia sp. NPDC058640]|uniref:serpin family protein n=1 Tax=Nocardia sp. NPDC058640 TaxID=3346571 RepID=UPI00365FD5BF
MGSSLMPHVRSSNALTGRWCATFEGGDAVVSGAGLWPLLAILASAAAGRARDELAAAVDVPAELAQLFGLEMLRSLDASTEVSTALGVWVRAGVPLRREWVDTMPTGTVGELGDSAMLDAWARERTDGLIEKFPVPIDPDTLCALATALLVRTRWSEAFRETIFAPQSGPWRGHRGPGLTRTEYADGSVAYLDDAVTRVIVTGTGQLDVHLLISDHGPIDALEAGIAALDGTIPAYSHLPFGVTAPCVEVTRVQTSNGNYVSLTLPPFEVESGHDLTDHADLFGLTAALKASEGHFPGLSPFPLAISAAGQNIVARFDALGFEAAAVSAVSMVAGSVPVMEWATLTTVTIDRPFGFMAVDRRSGLVLVAGQVTAPPVTWDRPVGEQPAVERNPGAPW